MVDPVSAELGPRYWDDDVAAWVSRARRGPGVSGPHGSTTAYWFGESSWGGPLIGGCFEPRSDDDNGDDDNGRGNDDRGGNGNGNGNGNDKPPKPPKPNDQPPPDEDDDRAVENANTGGLIPLIPFVASLPMRPRLARVLIRRETRT
jgi:hypothetical protein